MQIVDTFKDFNAEIYKELSAINDSFGNESTLDTRKKLDLFISKWDKEFEGLRKKKNDFTHLSDEIH